MQIGESGGDSDLVFSSSGEQVLVNLKVSASHPVLGSLRILA